MGSKVKVQSRFNFGLSVFLPDASDVTTNISGRRHLIDFSDLGQVVAALINSQNSFILCIDIVTITH